jgi:hypothetical protein
MLSRMLTERSFCGTINLDGMKRLSQFVSLALVLLMLAPPAFASMHCSKLMGEQRCTMSCCHGMDGMSMPVESDTVKAASHAQIHQTPCCIVTEIEATLTAPPVNQLSFDTIVFLTPTVEFMPPDLLPARKLLAEFPPGDAVREPALSGLCTFLI